MVRSRSRACRNAASVLPDPVGAMTSACWPVAIASQAPAWAAVGSAKEAVNHSRVGPESRSSAEEGVTEPFLSLPPTIHEESIVIGAAPSGAPAICITQLMSAPPGSTSSGMSKSIWYRTCWPGAISWTAEQLRP